ncbi:MAG: HEAT repeat domain-containing protein, partial [Chlamydiae bacterium]|nr:HEAT repeat domain-containing protein [Chlamydiota bacterium]
MQVLKQYRSGKIPLESALEAVRTISHSFSEAERDEAVAFLSELDHPEAQRELLQIFRNSQWRTTRLRIIGALSKNPTERTLEALFGIASDESDLPMCEESIWTLGRSGNRLAARFLIEAFETASSTIRPAIIAALGQIPDRSIAQKFLELLPAAIEKKDFLLAKNLILSLA